MRVVDISYEPNVVLQIRLGYLANYEFWAKQFNFQNSTDTFDSTLTGAFTAIRVDLSFCSCTTSSKVKRSILANNITHRIDSRYISGKSVFGLSNIDIFHMIAVHRSCLGKNRTVGLRFTFRRSGKVVIVVYLEWIINPLAGRIILLRHDGPVKDTIVLLR